jgi:acyl carrier protein
MSDKIAAVVRQVIADQFACRNLHDGMIFAGDLGADPLDPLEIGARIEEELDYPIELLELPATVGDLITTVQTIVGAAYEQRA